MCIPKRCSRAVLAAALLACLASRTAADRPGPETAAEEQPTKLFFGTAACKLCHGRDEPFQDPEFPPLCRCTEYGIWNTHDKHKEAYKVLSSERGQQIARLLKKDVFQPDTGCVSCHGALVPEDHAQLKDPTFKLEDGVSCAICHGSYKEWVSQHGNLLAIERANWRKLSRDEKEQHYGMTDLWDPAKRASLCLSCHLGSVEQNKLVTHAMYAAGHPPLPGVEVATFSEAMPRHWEYPEEKSPQVRELLAFPPNEVEQTKLLVVAGVAAMREGVHLLGAQAEACAEAEQPEDRLLDLANFDCSACHHDLKSPSWRQARGYSGLPGRPVQRPWPFALVELGVRFAARRSDAAEAELGSLRSKLAQLQDAFDARPFGDARAVVPAAHAVESWANDLIKRLEAEHYERTDSLWLLGQLCSLRGNRLPDYDSARQIAWAFRVLYSNLTPKPAGNPEIEQLLGELTQELALDLPAGQERHILEHLPKNLEAMGSYDPEEFGKRLGALGELLPEPPAGARQ